VAQIFLQAECPLSPSQQRQSG